MRVSRQPKEQKRGDISQAAVGVRRCEPKIDDLKVNERTANVRLDPEVCPSTVYLSCLLCKYITWKYLWMENGAATGKEELLPEL